jgi:hypothetical protein
MQRFAGSTHLHQSLAPERFGRNDRDIGCYQPTDPLPHNMVAYDRVLDATPHHSKPAGGSRLIQHDGRRGFGTMKPEFTRQLGSSGVAAYEIPTSMPPPMGNALGVSRTSQRVSDIESDNEDDELSEYSEDTEDAEWNIDTGRFIVAAENCNTHTEKPGTVREENGYLEWLEPKTKRWRKYQVSIPFV